MRRRDRGKATRRQRQKPQGDRGCQNLQDAAGIPPGAFGGSPALQGHRFPPRGTDFGSVAPRLCIALRHTQFVAMCSSSPRKRMKSPWLLSSDRPKSHLEAGKSFTLFHESDLQISSCPRPATRAPPPHSNTAATRPGAPPQWGQQQHHWWGRSPAPEAASTDRADPRRQP